MKTVQLESTSAARRALLTPLCTAIINILIPTTRNLLPHWNLNHSKSSEQAQLSQNHWTSWVGRDPRGSSSPTLAPHRTTQTLSLRALSKCFLNSGSSGLCPLSCGAEPPQHSSMPFPQALSLSHRAELSAVPPLPVRSCSRHEGSPQLLCSGLNKPRALSQSSYLLPSRSFLILLPFSTTVQLSYLHCSLSWNASSL